MSSTSTHIYAWVLYIVHYFYAYPREYLKMSITSTHIYECVLEISPYILHNYAWVLEIVYFIYAYLRVRAWYCQFYLRISTRVCLILTFFYLRIIYAYLRVSAWWNCPLHQRICTSQRLMKLFIIHLRISTIKCLKLSITSTHVYEWLFDKIVQSVM